jgi:hypothetical protein
MQDEETKSGIKGKELTEGEIIRYENTGVSCDDKKIRSGFSLRTLGDKKILLKGKIRNQKIHIIRNASGIWEALRRLILLQGKTCKLSGSLGNRKKSVTSPRIWTLRKGL